MSNYETSSRIISLEPLGYDTAKYNKKNLSPFYYFTRDELIVVVQMKEAAKNKALIAYLADPNVDLTPPKKEEKK